MSAVDWARFSEGEDLPVMGAVSSGRDVDCTGSRWSSALTEARGNSATGALIQDVLELLERTERVMIRGMMTARRSSMLEMPVIRGEDERMSERCQLELRGNDDNQSRSGSLVCVSFGGHRIERVDVQDRY